MKYIVLCTIAVLIALQSNANTIRIGLIPGNGSEIREKANQFASSLSNQLQKEISIYIPKDYQDLIDAMANKKVDFAFFTAMSFVYAEQQEQAKVLLKSVWKHPYYFSTIISHPDSGIKSIQDLRGKKIAFVDTKSTSGYLMPSLRLKKANITYDSIFTGNHKASVEKLINKEVDAIAVFANDKKAIQGAWNVYFEQSNFTPKILWVSQALPTDPFTVRSDYFESNPNTTYDVMFALMGLSNPDKDKNILQQTLGIRKLVTANSAQYKPIRKLIEDIPKN